MLLSSSLLCRSRERKAESKPPVWKRYNDSYCDLEDYVFWESRKTENRRQCLIGWLLSLKHSFINVPFHILVASLTLMDVFLQSHQSQTRALTIYEMTH